jgi:molybdate transport system ATP-binding protein
METKTIAIAGLNASGKTLMVERMRRELHSDSVRYVAFCDTYGTITDRSYYLQQRWNQHDIEEETPYVADALERSFLLSGSDTPTRRQNQQRLYQLLGMEALLGKYVISLSSGELRKMQLVKTLMANPEILILDNAFIGLDAEARAMLSQLLRQLKEQGMKLYLIVARPGEIPDFADEIIWTTDEQEFRRPLSSSSHPSSLSSHHSPEVIRMTDVSIRYGERTILDRLSWTVCQGEHWALSGRNGSGKSTLLSLVCADNPQSYACNIALFGHQRGTGESIWEIKRHIGYVSPELHRSYRRNLPAIHIVASGLKDTVGLYVRMNEDERQQCLQWMEKFNIADLADRSFLQLSSGEQRLVLVCRAFVKNPNLLILDEPMHGLDMQRQQLVKDIINDYCADPTRTLIMVSHYEEELPSCIDHRLRL